MSEEDALLSNQPKSSGRLFKDAVGQFRYIPKDLWMILFTLWTLMFAYYAVVVIIPLFLSDDYGYSDVEAGFIYGAMGATWTLYAVFLGTVVDRWGIKKSV
jgi:predicted MFS family arabinose efflux permease